MNDDQTPEAPQPAGTDPLDETQRVDVPRYAPTPDPRPDARWAWASPTGEPAQDRWYQPAPGEPVRASGPAGPAWGSEPAWSTSVEPVAAAAAPAATSRR